MWGESDSYLLVMMSFVLLEDVDSRWGIGNQFRNLFGNKFPPTACWFPASTPKAGAQYQPWAINAITHIGP